MQSLSKPNEKKIARKFLIDFVIAFTVATVIVVLLAMGAAKLGEIYHDYKHETLK